MIMQKLPSSIFNDVIGPVMRGQSSSHVAGEARIAVGGGMVEMQRLEEFKVNICGGFFELLVMLDTEKMSSRRV